MTGPVLEPATVDGAARLAMLIDREDVVRRTQSKYKGEWWKSNDPYVLAQMQLREEILLIPFARFHEAVELVLGRAVFADEFIKPEKLLSEVMGRKP